MKLLYALPILLLIGNLQAQTRYLSPVFDQVTVTKNITYGQNATIIAASVAGQAISQPLALDLYEPQGDTNSSRPLVLLIHGGRYLQPNNNGLCDGVKSDSAVVEISTRLAKMGYLVAAIDYRQGWNPVSPTESVRRTSYIQAIYRGVQDANTAIRYFKKTVAQDANPFRVDTTRLVLWGDATGGQIALSAAYANTQGDWQLPSLTIPPSNVPIIVPEVYGNLWGSNVGVNLPGFTIFNGLPEGDTLCYPNWPGYSSEFQLCVSMGGAMLDLPWIDAGEMPAVLYHNPDDTEHPCEQASYLVAPFNLSVAPVKGSCTIAAQMDLLGNNQVFWDADINDCVTSTAFIHNGDLEGFYPFTGLEGTKGRPWQWVASCPNNPNALTNGAFARNYIDTVLTYFAPRACAALALCNTQPDPNGVCGTQVKGKVYLDANQNTLYETGEMAFSNVVIELEPGGKYDVSGPNGGYSISAAPGNYTLSVPNPPTYYSTSNAPAAITIPVGGDTILNLGFSATAMINDLQVVLTSVSDPRPGFSNTLSIVWKNVGTTTLSGTVTVNVDPNYIVLSGTPTPSIVGNTATWTFSNLPPFQSQSATLMIKLPVTIPIGTLLGSTVSVEPGNGNDETPLNNLDTLIQTVIGSFDPNDKRVTPDGQVTASIFEENAHWLDYTVRFQNTGTAEAFNIHIVDTLSELLNVGMVEVLAASHPMHWDISGRNILTFYFDNILLPDSFSNEVASHGFVRFRVKPTLDFPGLLGKSIHNFADIYFDFNAPVRTNTVASNFVETSKATQPTPVPVVEIAPNPASEQLMIFWPTVTNTQNIQLRVSSSDGQTLFYRAYSNDENRYEKINVAAWPKGLYFVTLISDNGSSGKRFVKE